jgi:hypothetical protein
MAGCNDHWLVPGGIQYRQDLEYVVSRAAKGTEFTSTYPLTSLKIGRCDICKTLHEICARCEEPPGVSNRKWVCVSPGRERCIGKVVEWFDKCCSEYAKSYMESLANRS